MAVLLVVGLLLGAGLPREALPLVGLGSMGRVVRHRFGSRTYRCALGCCGGVVSALAAPSRQLVRLLLLLSTWAGALLDPGPICNDVWIMILSFLRDSIDEGVFLCCRAWAQVAVRRLSRRFHNLNIPAFGDRKSVV